MTAERRRRTAQSNGANGASPNGTHPEEPLAFEEALGRLDETVAALENGQLPLDDALSLYEEGVRLAQRCQQMLDTAELRLQRLRPAPDGEPTAGPFILDSFELDDRE
jgi:exodeoxyribonuclease VII small subunit